MSLRRIVTGTAFVSSASVIRILAQFIAIPILSRLLDSSDYGLVAIASPFIVFAMLITDAGIGMSLVRSTPLADDVTWSTSFWVISALGGALAVILLLLSPFAAYAFDEPGLQPVLSILSVTIAVQAMVVIPGAALQQSRRFSTVAIIEIIATILGIATAVTAALMGLGVWSLVGQQVVFFAVRVVLTVSCSPFRPRLIFDLSAIRHHLVFGRDVLGTNVIAHMSGSIDNLAIGGLLGATPVGYYNMAMQFIRLPTMIITGPLQYVLFSHLATIKENLPAIRRTFLLITRILAILVFPALAMIAAAHHSIFAIALSEKWSQSGTLFMVMAAGGAVQAMMALGGDIMLVLGRSDLRLRTTAEFSLIWIVTLLLSVLISRDIHWVAVAYACAVICYTPRTLGVVLSLIRCPFRQYLEAIAVPALVSPVTILLYTSIVEVSAPSKIVDVAVAAGLTVVTMAVCALIQLRPLRDESAGVALPFRSAPATQ